ncbi:DUF2382 domain-containing protein [Paracoccus mutanolyticus]|uniref:DUF2382 domain-containing protein n=1 Tax=Paracoccus mutanolyticus TaxID=1499308 RepID=UPI001CB93086|nr:DUF2382 domain-containing protein [Paracoccus mutanolyticus]
MPDEPDDSIPVIQEQVGVSVERRLAGRVRVSVRTQTDESLVPVDLTQVDVAVERVPVNRAVDTAPEVVTRGDLTIIPVVEERLVVTRNCIFAKKSTSGASNAGRRPRCRSRPESRSRPSKGSRRTRTTRSRPQTLTSSLEKDSTMTYSDMQTTGNSTITAMFDSRADAERATARLRDAGFSSSQISMVEGDETAGATPDPDRSKGFWDSLGDFFFPEQDRYTYAEGLSRGGYLVTVTGLQAGTVRHRPGHPGRRRHRRS